MWGKSIPFVPPLPTNAHRDIASNIILPETVFETTAPLNTHVTSARVSTLPKHASLDQTSQRQQLPTPVNHHNLRIMLKGYSDIDYVVSGFHNGFQLHYQGPNQSFQLSNSTSAHQHSKFLISYIARELQLGRIAGPFSSPPLDNFIVSPIAVVPKKEPGVSVSFTT